MEKVNRKAMVHITRITAAWTLQTLKTQMSKIKKMRQIQTKMMKQNAADVVQGENQKAKRPIES